MQKVSKSMKKIVPELNKCMNKPIVSNTLIVLLAVSAVLVVPRLPLSTLSFMNNMYVRLMLMTLIALLCLVDPVKALLLAINFVVALQRLHNLQKVASANNVLNAVNNVLNNNANAEEDEAETPTEPENSELLNNVVPANSDENDNEEVAPSSNLNLGNNANVVLNNAVEKPTISNVAYNVSPNNLDNLINENNNNAEKDAQNTVVIGELLQEGFEDHLKGSNINNNLSIENANGIVNNVLTAPVSEDPESVFTSKNQLLDAQSNLVDCKGNNEVVRSQGSQHSAQGFGNPEGVPTGYSW